MKKSKKGPKIKGMNHLKEAVKEGVESIKEDKKLMSKMKKGC